MECIVAVLLNVRYHRRTVRRVLSTAELAIMTQDRNEARAGDRRWLRLNDLSAQ